MSFIFVSFIMQSLFNHRIYFRNLSLSLSLSLSLESLRLVHFSRKDMASGDRRFIREDAFPLSTRCDSLTRKWDEARKGTRQSGGEAKGARMIPGNRLPRAMKSLCRSCTRRLVVGGYRDVLILPRVPRGEIDTHRVIRFPSSPLYPMFSRAMG